MKRIKPKLRKNNLGYTIVETMIVMAVTGVMFTSIALMVSGRQNKTEFQTSISDVQTAIQQIANEVGTGFYPDANYGCANIGDKVNLSGGANTGACIMLGKALHFDSSNSTNFQSFTIVGLPTEKKSAADQVYSKAAPYLAAMPSYNSQNPGNIDVTQYPALNYGLAPYKLRYTPVTGSATDAGSFAFMLGLQAGVSNAAAGSSSTGTSATKTVSIVSFTQFSSIANNKDTEVTAVNQAFDQSKLSVGGKVEIYFDSGTTKQCGKITINGSGSYLDVKRVILNGACSANVT